MNLTLDETQVDLRDLARSVLTRQVTADRLELIEATEHRFDRELWSTFAETGLLAAGVGERDGGLGLGVVGAALVCAEVGRAVAAVPYAAAACAALTLAAPGAGAPPDLVSRLARAETLVLAVPPVSARRARLSESRLTGTLAAVPWAHVADGLLVTVDEQVVLVDPRADGVRATPGETTAREVALDLDLVGAPVVRVGGPDVATFLTLCWLTLLAATQSGVTDAAVRLTADYTSNRRQFGRPLSTFQGVTLQAADAYLDARAIEAVALQAAWSLDVADDPAPAVLTAAWWAAEAGQHCVHVTQHLHGGVGADVTYPLHRYFLWGKQIELLCGPATRLLVELGDVLAARPHAGDAVTLDG